MAYHYAFINNVLGNFFRDTLDFYAKEFYPRFQWDVIGTYDKAVEYVTKTLQVGREADKPLLPALILNPTGEFNTVEGSSGGKQFYRFPNLAPGFALKMYDPIYEDGNVRVTPGWTRLKGDFELICLCSSFYEYCDLRMLFIQFFGGNDRPIYPIWFKSFIILPPELINFNYKNEVSGEDYVLDWAANGMTDKLILSTAKNEKVVECNIRPWYSLSNISDSSERYGGTDNLADWKLSVTLTYEVEIPSFLVIEADYLASNMDMWINYASTRTHFNHAVVQQHQERITNGEKHYVLSQEYFHLFTQAEADSHDNILIDLPEIIDSNNLVYLIMKNDRFLIEYTDYVKVLSGNITTFELYRLQIPGLLSGDYLEFVIYKELEMGT